MNNDSAEQRFNGSTSSKVVISVEGLWKQYRYGTISHATLHKDLQSWWARVRGKEDPNSRIGTTGHQFNGSTSSDNDRFWALQDINFEVKQGEVLGIIGRNGVGKSTLLKIMSKVTTPTKGEIKIRGRVASLLEVGTGFHPELTGRENIFLNGAILGMTKDEIRRKFDEIVAFAEIDKFIDTPVKRYSSGMYVRLAFAVAAHLDPEILIVDEVLAVGDAQFQKKCLGKMGDVAKEGRTVLFVSHNMDAINTLCSRTIVVDSGNIIFDGVTEYGINAYLKSAQQGALIVDLSDPKSGYMRSGQRQYGQIISVSSMNANAAVTDMFEMGKPFAASMVIRIRERVNDPEMGFCISTPKGARLHHLISKWEKEIGVIEAGTYRFTAGIDRLMLYPGTYTLTVWFRRFSLEGSDDFVEAPLVFKVIRAEDTPDRYDFSNVSSSGGVYVKAAWAFEGLNDA